MTAVGQREWDAYVEGCPSGTMYHLWGWREVFERGFDHRAIYLAARQGGEITGVLPLVQFDHALFGRFLVSLPFVNYGGVLASNDAAARALVDHARRLGERAKSSHVELRHFDQRFPDLQARRHKVTMLLPLAQSPEAMWEKVDKKVRNQVRKAQKSELTTEAGGAGLLAEFYDVFCRNMRDLGTPVYGRRFFEEVLRQFPDRARVFVVRKGTMAVAAGISLAYHGSIEIPWASSLRDYRTICPNYLLYWTMVEFAIARGFEQFDFGRSTPDDGPYHFKKQWGARAVPLCWEYQLLRAARLPDRSTKNPKFQAAIAVWQRLPLSLASFVGPRVARYLP
ncbi:MAG: FemAB family PEP-CTERM system-associated protein [Acidobacteria bacterium]|nr:FemAB family PEP-CTERM system-associated protein [Acidobacteriota bacterium]